MLDKQSWGEACLLVQFAGYGGNNYNPARDFPPKPAAPWLRFFERRKVERGCRLDPACRRNWCDYFAPDPPALRLNRLFPPERLACLG